MALHVVFLKDGSHAAWIHHDHVVAAACPSRLPSQGVSHLVDIRKTASCSTDRDMAVECGHVQSQVHVSSWHVVNNIASDRLASGNIPVPKREQDTNNQITYPLHSIPSDLTVAQYIALDQIVDDTICVLFLFCVYSAFTLCTFLPYPTSRRWNFAWQRAHFPSHEFDRSLCLARLSSRSSLTLCTPTARPRHRPYAHLLLITPSQLDNTSPRARQRTLSGLYKDGM